MHIDRSKLKTLIPLTAEILMCVARNLLNHSGNSYTSVPLSGQQESPKDSDDTTPVTR